MKILLVSNYNESAGGISGQVKLLSENLRDEGELVSIFSTKSGLLRRLWLFLKLMIVARKYDILHIHACSYWGFLPAIYGILIGTILKKRIVLTYHGGDGEAFFSSHPKFVRWFLTRTHANIVLSGFLAKVFEEHGLSYVVIPNMLSRRNMDRTTLRTQIKPCYISIRSLEPIYNIECILRAFEMVKKQLPESELLVLGDGKCRASLERFVRDNGIENVTFLGHVSNKDIDYYLNQADVFLSAPNIDNQPMSFLEAFRAGCLVISSRVGGVPYMIEHGVTGLMFEKGNFQELALQMTKAVTDQHASLSMIEKAKEQLMAYSWSFNKYKIYKCYNHGKS